MTIPLQFCMLLKSFFITPLQTSSLPRLIVLSFEALVLIKELASHFGKQAYSLSRRELDEKIDSTLMSAW